MTTVHVFIGPTLRQDEARLELDAVVHPPAAVGDVYRVACGRPQAIGIIDGFFERTASVWHKEILWAMAEGVHVFGAASMGALRAAELADYGMEGAGRIYAALRSGEIVDDDEVAVAHASADGGYRAISEAMVNIRATLTAAAEQTVISAHAQRELERLAKSLFYADRSYERLLCDGLEAGLPKAEVQALRAWLRQGRTDQKRQDAIELLRLMRDRLAQPLAPKRVSYRFEHTQTWEMLRKRIAGQTG
jgi:hypothetical protein